MTRFTPRLVGVVIVLTTLAAPTIILGQSTSTLTHGDVPVSGDEVAALRALDELMLRYVTDHGSPGAALAVSRQGKLIYARGFGWADANAQEPVVPRSLFRIASVSKPITAVAVLQLVERGKMQLQQNPFEVIGMGDLLDIDDTDTRLFDVTIGHLLYHTGGWDSDETFDPVFAYRRIAEYFGTAPPPTHRQIIEYMLRQPLQFDPGERHVYSNFGYLVLGRVIEAGSGQTYEAYVTEHVLRPLGITTMRLGRSLPEDRLDDEVVYYAADVGPRQAIMDPDRELPRPYTFARHISDAGGGWVASAVDLVRFADAFNPDAKTTVLSRETIELMFVPPPGALGHRVDGTVKEYSYAMGWEIRPFGWNRINDVALVSHDGRIPGTSAIIVRRADGVNWAVVFNRDKSKVSNRSLANTIRGEFDRAVAAVTWRE